MAPQHPVWAFDVDGTLIGSIRSDRLRPGARDLLEQLANGGVRCVLWSAGGGDYAERMAHRHDIAMWFGAFHSKRDRGPDGRFPLTDFDPADLPAVFVDDAPAEVPLGAHVIAVPQFLGGNRADRALYDVRARADHWLSSMALGVGTPPDLDP